ncbi:hypothetical protein BBD64_17075 [Klebsiella variicola]|nr:hypothetical protein BBD63_17075 [Klebsiella variicola]AQL21973.1 hypothetical protein BBD64_17075 [Klebsiella variicola]AQL27733.1 hypothetical protein BBD65_17075 [Klebsiella variicola]
MRPTQNLHLISKIRQVFKSFINVLTQYAYEHFQKRMDLPDCVLAGLTSAQIYIQNWKLAGHLTMSVLYLLLLVNMHYRIVNIFSRQRNIALAGEEGW